MTKVSDELATPIYCRHMETAGSPRRWSLTIDLQKVMSQKPDHKTRVADPSVQRRSEHYVEPSVDMK